jgi:N-acetylmuramoyl-L-alanine amidase
MTTFLMSLTKRRLICGCSIFAACVAAAIVVHAEDEPKKSGFFGRIVDLVKKKEEPPPPAPEEKPKSEVRPKTTTSANSKGTGETAKSKTTASQTKKKAAPKPAEKVPAKDQKVETPKTEVAKKAEEKAPATKTVDKKEDTASATKKVEPVAQAKDFATGAALSTMAKPEPAPDKAVAEGAKPATEKAKVTDASKTPAVMTSPVEKASEPPAASVSVDPPGRPMGGFAPGDERAIDVTSSTRVGTTTTSPSTKLTEPSGSTGVVTPLPPGKGGGWEIVKYEGRDYITAASIQRFYGFSTLRVDRSHVWLKTTNLILKAQIGSMEMLINNVKFVLSYPVSQSGGKVIFSRLDLCKLIDPVLRPSYIVDADAFDTVVLDPGHGGHDAGARGVYGYEKDFALKMAFVVKASLEKRGFKVVMTRTTDQFISRTGRVGIANKTPNSIFISLHFNSGGPAATGIETFALTPQGGSASLERGGGYNASGLTGNRQDSENIALATAVHARVVSTYKLIDRGIKRAQWTVLTGCNRPGILFEGGFVTNATECRFIASDTYRRALAETIGEAVVNYRKALQPPNTVKRSSSPYGR